MDRGLASKILREKMTEHGLNDWSARLNPVSLDSSFQYMGLCSHKDKTIILNAHHVDMHEEKDVVNTILHEIAHALVGPFAGHNEVWAEKAREIGCFHVAPCSTLGLPLHVIDAIRSGATVEVEMKEDVVRTATYKITRLQARCPSCGKVAVTKSERVWKTGDKKKFDKKITHLMCGHMIISQLPKATPFHTITMDGDSSCSHEWDKTICSKCNAKKPYQFQIEGMQFAERALVAANGAIIMDEMGLGKTIQALGLLLFHKEWWPVLFIVKSGLKFQWWSEIIRICGMKNYCQVIQSSKDPLFKGRVRGYIVGFDMLVQKTRMVKGKPVTSGFDIAKFVERGIKTIVIDECQQIKNVDSSRTQMVRRIVKDTGAKVIGLSGTPWKNRGSEFFSILNLIDPMKFSSYQGYKDTWVSTYFDGKYTKEGGIKNPAKFKEFIKHIAIRRERTEVMKELPLINRTRLHMEMSQLHTEEYDESVSDFVAWYNNVVIGGEDEGANFAINMLAKMSQMRHITGLAKIPATQEFVEQFFEETDRKLVVFVHHKDVGAILYEWAAQKFGNEFYVGKISADMNSLARQETQDTFNKTQRALIIASTLAAGEGLNLQTCADCVMHERQWNPANEEQAEGRFIRIGQTATSVNATYVLAADSIDEMFDQIVERKRVQFHDAMNNTKRTEWNQSDLGKELADAIVKAFMKKHPQGIKTIDVKNVKADNVAKFPQPTTT
jgi:SWI/SNF-related matrix-associated actin-dependent regulator 1 of chromatin subfamily A